MIQVVIATHTSYTHALSHLLQSLDYKRHLHDIIVVIAGVPTHNISSVTEAYVQSFGLQHVLCDPSNNYEFTAFYAMGKHLRNSLNAPQFTNHYYVFLHDTTQAGATFWQDVQRLANTAPPTYDWLPFCDNFNMGIASAPFLTNIVYPAFNHKQLSKQECIDAELDPAHPLNLKALAAGKWRYAHNGVIVEPKAQRPWRNDTLVYSTDQLRCIVRLEVPLLYKFVRLQNASDLGERFRWDHETCTTFALNKN